MSEHVRIRKIGTRSGRPEMLDDGHVVEGDELLPPTPGVPYAVRRTVIEHEDAPEVLIVPLPPSAIAAPASSITEPPAPPVPAVGVVAIG